MKRSLLLSFLLIVILFSVVTFAHAQTSPNTSTSNVGVQAQIDANNSQISQIEQQIAGYQKQLNTLGTQKQTLQSNIQQIDISREQTQAQAQLTQAKIQEADLAIQKLGTQITTKQQDIDVDKQTLAASLRQINEDDVTPFIAAIFSAQNIEDLWNSVGAEMQLTEALQQHQDALASDTLQLTSQQTQVTTTEGQLTTLDKNLQTQEGQLNATKASKQQLLAQTNSQESTYETLIATKKAQEQAFENELAELQNTLKGVSASAIPASGQGILAWPFADSIMQNCVGKQSVLGNIYCITQYFGNTPFATANPAIYSGMGHDGVDIGVPIGTPVQAALSGVVAGTGDTDLVHDAEGDQCYSFGKWIMLQHANGLNTMYAHLSQIDVSKGQAVNTGDVIGYSGMTGYATGPHLHFGVYATAGVKYMTLGAFHGTQTPCSEATMPVAPPDAYLNPLSYLL